MRSRFVLTRALLLCTCCACAAVPLAAQQCPDGTAPPCGQARRPAAAPAMSVAVLTFQSRSRDTNDIFLGEGLADDIAARLGQVGSIVMRSREAVRRLPNADAMSMPELGRRLNASYIVSGSVQPAGGRLRVMVELTRAQSSGVTWTSPYDRTRDDILTMQAEIATAVASAVAGRLGAADTRRLAASPTRNAEAFVHLARGTAFMARRLFGNDVAELRAAVRLDSTSAVAWARLSQARALCASWGCRVDSMSVMQREARAAADRALALDANSSDAWLADGLALINAARPDLPAARRSLERAVRLDPRSAEARHVLAFVDLRLGDLAGATRGYREALAIDPGRAITWAHLARIAWAEGRFRLEEALADTALVFQPGLGGGALGSKWEAVIWQGDAPRMRGLGASLGYGDSLTTVYEDAFARLAEGDTAGANVAIDRLRAAGLRQRLLVLLLGRAGRRADAADIIRRWSEPDIFAWWELRSPAYAELRGLPEFDAYLERARARALWTERPR